MMVLCYEAYVWQAAVALAADMLLLYVCFKTYAGTNLAEHAGFAAESENGFTFLGEGFNQFDLTVIFLLCYGILFILLLLGDKKVRRLMQNFLLIFLLTELILAIGCWL